MSRQQLNNEFINYFDSKDKIVSLQYHKVNLNLRNLNFVSLLLNFEAKLYFNFFNNQNYSSLNCLQNYSINYGKKEFFIFFEHCLCSLFMSSSSFSLNKFSIFVPSPIYKKLTFLDKKINLRVSSSVFINFFGLSVLHLGE